MLWTGAVIIQKARIIKLLGYLIVILGGCFYCYEYFLRISPSIMLPELQHAFDLNATLLGTLSAFYYYAYTPLQLLVGIVVDRYHVKKVLIMAIAACILGTALIATAHQFYLVATGRFLQGFGSAFAFVGSLKLAATWVPKNQFALFSGMINFFGFIGAGISETAMSYTVQHFGWRQTLMGLAYLGIVLAITFALMAWITHRTRHHHQQRTKHELHLKQHFIYLWIALKAPKIWLTGIFAGLMFLPTSVFAELWGARYLEMLHHYAANQASWGDSMIFYGWGIGAIFVGWLSDKINRRTPIMRIGALLAAALSILLLYDAHLSYFLVCTLFLIFGIFSSVEILSFVVAKDLSASKHAVGTSIALINAICMLGGMIFQRGVGELLDSQWSGAMFHGHPVYSINDYEHAIIIVPISLGLAFLVSIFIRDTQCR